MQKIYQLPEKDHINWITVLGAMLMIFGILLGLFVATEYVAFRLNFRSELGRSLFGLFYNPFNLFIWMFAYGKVEVLKPVFLQAAGIFGVTVIGTSAFLVVINYKLKSKSRKSDLCGSAHWATEEEIQKEGLKDSQSGLYIGAWYNERKGMIEYLRYSGEGNFLGVAPTGTGKGVCMVIPNLLTWPNSVLVNDVKGENWALSSGYRRNVLNNIVIKFDPTDQDNKGACFNPLWEIRMGVNEVRDTQNILEIICDPHEKEVPTHWSERAQEMLLGVILHVLYTHADKSLGGVSQFLSGQGKTDYQVLEEMLNAVHDHEFTRGWRNTFTDEPTQTHPVVSSVARQLINMEAEERSGIISTARRFLRLYLDPIISRNLSRSDFRISDLMLNDKPVSLYIIIPESDKDRLRPLVRIILKLISSRLLERMEFENGRSVAWYKHSLLLVLDEFSGLGKLQFMESDLAIIRGYGIRALIIVQEIAQIYKHYTKNESITSNCHVKMFFAPNKLDTAQEISGLAGTSTVTKFTKNVSGKMTQVVPVNLSESIAEVQRPLITPDELLRLPKDDMLIFVGSMPPIYGKKIRYYEDEVFSKRSQIPPPETSDRITVTAADLGFPTRVVQIKEVKKIKAETIQIEELLIQESNEETGKDTMRL